MKSKTIIFYDGVCFVCSSAIKTLIKIYKKNILYFSPLQSNFAKSTIDKKYLEKLDTVIAVSYTHLRAHETKALRGLRGGGG